ncbi:MAG: undecaprenyl-diphosphate phosphatase [Isosphaeraceae bacterium]|nr:undecaprenyl-diphosphate phosphatase [Isosphaeraceae bacterium]
MRWLDAIILGVVQGLTEFLPISSDGHLSVAEKVLDGLSGVPRSGGAKLFFVVMLHLGTLAAILIHYRRVGLDGARGFLLDAQDVPESLRRGSVFKAGLLACLATLPAVPVGLFLKGPIEAAFDSLPAAGIGFLVTAFVLGLTMRLKGGERELADTTWLDALLIGSAQALAVLPGVSRSGMTISVALALGFSRTWAVGFSLWIAVPAILGATVLEIKDVDTTALTREYLGPLFVGIFTSGVVGYLAILWLVRVVKRGRMWYFSVYLVGLAVAIFTWLWIYGGAANGPATTARERPALQRSTLEVDRSDRRVDLGRMDRLAAAHPAPLPHRAR